MLACKLRLTERGRPPRERAAEAPVTSKRGTTTLPKRGA